uniref:ATP synthase F0 subunit 8 n=1 Tax=Stenamma impar TaxID=625363 RepID=UPI001FCCDDB6|nr:ATP synthase F0 subunit 8 [Stenamma impar]UNZ99561.1 ATP synthase F0 subunit 8 [Stenamma impar]
MPQMMPILWFILMMYTIILMMMTIASIYFSQSYPSLMPKKMFNKYNNNWNWKW